VEPPRKIIRKKQPAKREKDQSRALVSQPHQESALILRMLPSDLLIRIVSYLHVCDLCRISTTNKEFGKLTATRQVWSSLFVGRWPVFRQENELTGFEWRRQYKEQHLKELRAISESCPADTLPYFLQMEKAKQSQAPRAQNEFRVIEEWLSRNPFARVVDYSKHDCSLQSCSYYVRGNVYICEKTGKVHFCPCDVSACDLITTSDGSRHCPVSARSFCLTPGDIADSQDADRYDDRPSILPTHPRGEEDEDEEELPGTFLARCYTYGYSCRSEEDLPTIDRDGSQSTYL